MRMVPALGLVLAMAVRSDAQSLAAPARGSVAAVDQLVAAELSSRIGSYVQLRDSLEASLPPLTADDDPREVLGRERTLAQRIRAARRRARQGDIFTSQIAAGLRRVLKQEEDSATWRMIMDENPGPFPRMVNGIYPKTKPLSTVPPNVLARLPRLPDGLQYRFVGPDLILHDTRANLIVDRIPEAISLARPPRGATAR